MTRSAALRDITNTNANQQIPDPSVKQQKRRSEHSRPTYADLATLNIDPADPQQVGEYAHEIFKYLHIKEQSPDIRIQPNFLNGHAEVNSRMRSILLEWLVEVHYKFKLQPETLYLCLNIIDRYLQIDRAIPKRRLQLLGGTSMLIASKFEEYRPPEIRDICYIMDNAYSKDEVLVMECDVLNTLKFGLTTASPLQFLDFFIRSACHRESEMHLLSQFCLECSLVDVELCTYLPSQLASVALFTASKLMYGGERDQSPFIPMPHSEQTATLLQAKLLRVIVIQKDKALGKKYAKDRYKRVIQYVTKSPMIAAVIDEQNRQQQQQAAVSAHQAGHNGNGNNQVQPSNNRNKRTSPMDVSAPNAPAASPMDTSSGTTPM